MNPILEIPEVQALGGPSSLIRIPNQIDVPVTKRVMRLIDTPEFQRLTKISQLGMVSFVYPAANHNRFEHSLGVYRNCLLFLQQFASQSRFVNAISQHDATVLLLASLFHDIGHWPYCHPIEDINIEGLPSHENFAKEYLLRKPIADCLEQDWQIEPQQVVDLINRKKSNPTETLLCSILSGPIDIDKMDYLYRDSLHAGVPYGQNFDSLRLIRSLCLNQDGNKLAISRKGKTAAELMVFARYVMFSEVYWHHAVRSATAMFQRAFFLWHQHQRETANFDTRLVSMFELSEHEMVDRMRDEATESSAKLLDQLFGPTRKLYKRVANYTCNENETLYRQIAQRPYAWLLDKSRKLATLFAESLNTTLDPESVLIDAPPVGLEVQFDVDVYYPETQSYRKLGEVSPVVKTLAQQQFDDFVKQVRVFVAPEWADDIKKLDVDSLVMKVLNE